MLRQREIEAMLLTHAPESSAEAPNATLNQSPAPAQTIAWNCAYHVLLAHAAAVKRFRAAVPGGKISMNINSDWSEPYSSSAQDQVHPVHVSEQSRNLEVEKCTKRHLASHCACFT